MQLFIVCVLELLSCVFFDSIEMLVYEFIVQPNSWISGFQITKLTKIIHATRDVNFQVLAGSAGFLLPALHAGKCFRLTLKWRLIALYFEWFSRGRALECWRYSNMSILLRILLWKLFSVSWFFRAHQFLLKLLRNLPIIVFLFI